MSLGSKTLLVLAISLAGYALADLIVQRFFILPTYREFEEESARRDLTRCVDALRRELHHLDRFCQDWSAWDDTLSFVSGEKPEYPDENLDARTFINGELNLMAFYDRAGRLVWSKGFDYVLKTPLSFTAFETPQLPKEYLPLQHANPNGHIAGILTTEVGPLLLISRPVVGTYRQDSIGGTLFMGRLLDSGMQNTLRQQTQVDLTIYPVHSTQLPPATRTALAEISGVNPVHLRVDDSGNLNTHTIFHDIFGKAALIFSLRLPRDIYDRGSYAMKLDTIGAFTASLVVLALAAFLMQRAVIRPLRGLTEHVSHLTHSGEIRSLPAHSRSDEIGALTTAFNSLMARIESDIARRAETERALALSEARLGSILETAPDVIISVDEHGHIDAVNPAITALLGYSQDELTRKPLALLVEEHRRNLADRGVRAFLARQGRVRFPVGGEMLARRKDGITVPVLVSVQYTERDGKGGLTAVARDISELKAMHEQVARERHLAEIGEMGASVAHEIRNPLTGISSATQVILATLAPEHPHRAVLEEMLAQVHRVEHTVLQLLDYSRNWRPQRVPTNCGALLSNVRAEFLRWNTDARVVIEVHAPEEFKVNLDPLLIGQVLHNLLQNSFQAMNGKGTMTISLIPELEWVCIEVADEGPGFSPQVISSGFRPFFTSKTYGTGLGLPVSRRIVEAHAGRMEFCNRASGGAVVRVLLPSETAQ